MNANEALWDRLDQGRLACELQLWAEEAQAELELFEGAWNRQQLSQVNGLSQWLEQQQWAAVAANWQAQRHEVYSIRNQWERLSADAWLNLGPSLSPALNTLIWVLENPDSGREAQAVAAIDCILAQTRHQEWEEAELAELQELLDQCLMTLLSAADLDGAVLDRLVELLDRSTHADVSGPTSSRCWNSWLRLLEVAPVEELDEPLERLDADVQAFAQEVEESQLLSDYQQLSQTFREQFDSLPREQWLRRFESLLSKLDETVRLGRSGKTNRARQLCLQYRVGALSAAEFKAGLQELKLQLQELGRSLAGRGQELETVAEASAELRRGLELLESVQHENQKSEMASGCESIERGLEILQTTVIANG